MNKIPVNKFLRFNFEYFNRNRFPNQRFGQAFLNEHLLIVDPDLFYCEDVMQATDIILAKYIDYGESNEQP